MYYKLYCLKGKSIKYHHIYLLFNVIHFNKKAITSLHFTTMCEFIPFWKWFFFGGPKLLSVFREWKFSDIPKKLYEHNKYLLKLKHLKVLCFYTWILFLILSENITKIKYFNIFNSDFMLCVGSPFSSILDYKFWGNRQRILRDYVTLSITVSKICIPLQMSWYRNQNHRVGSVGGLWSADQKPLVHISYSLSELWWVGFYFYMGQLTFFSWITWPLTFTPNPGYPMCAVCHMVNKSVWKFKCTLALVLEILRTMLC